MSEPEQQRGPVYYAPNQQTVRPDGSGPGTPPEGGTGGSTPPIAATTKRGPGRPKKTEAEGNEAA